MGKRTGRRMDLLSEQTGALVVLGLAFFLCGLAGILAAGQTGAEACNELHLELAGLLELQQTGQHISFFRLLWFRLCMAGPVLILCTSPLGIIGLPLVLGWYGFRFAASVALSIRACGLAGFPVAFGLFGLTGFLWLPVLLLISGRGLPAAGIRAAAGNREAGKCGAAWLAGCCVLLLVCVIVEYFAAPVLLRVAAQAVL